MSDFGAAYSETRESLSEIARSLEKESLDRIVPACPEWSIKDLVAHVTGVAADSMAGDVGEAGRPEWTSRQIEARADASIDAIVDEWTEVAHRLEPMLDEMHPALAALLIGDLVTHYHDALGALGRPDDRDAAAVSIATAGYARWLGRRIKDGGAPTLELRAAGESWIAGKEQPRARVSAPSKFDLLRALTGRRTRSEVAALGWEGDPDPYLALFSAYGYPEQSLDES